MKSFYHKVIKRLTSSINSKYVNLLDNSLKKFAFEWQGALIVTPCVAGLTVAIRLLGWLEPLELTALDAGFRLRPNEPTDERIVIVGICESDLARLKQWPLNDATLAKLLNQIKQQQPKVIGLDLYRNLPVEPGYGKLVKVFKNTQNLIGIQKAIGERFSSQIAPPPELAALGQISANDIVVDADGVLRRGMLYPIPGEPLPSLGLAVATAYLQDKNIVPEAASNGFMKLGKTVFTAFEENDGGYSRADAGGYQVLLNFRGAAGSFRSVSVTDVLENRVSPTLMRDRIVLIGALAPSLNDAFYTPYSQNFRSTPVRTFGVEIQASLASQILSSVLDNRPQIQVWNELAENLWILLWAAVIAGTAWQWRHKAHLFLLKLTALLLAAIVTISVIAYIFFIFGWWIPVVPPLLALFGSSIGISSYVYVSRLRELNAKLEQTVENLSQALLNLQQSQIQLIQSEKMSALGQLVAGVAHEINNPIGFISGNIQCLQEYLQDLTNHLQLYQQKFPNPGTEIEKDAKAIDLEYILEDLSKIIGSMDTGIERVRDISISLRTFSRSDTSTKVPFNIHESIDSTLLILKHRLKANNIRPEIKIIKEYGELPLVNCFPGQISQVFMNLIANAIDAFDECNSGKSFAEIQANPNKITIFTEVLADNSLVAIRVKDNGLGMSEDVKQKIFEHLFTTKPVGKGTGLGLSISRQIVEESHGGKLSCVSAPGEGAEFIVEIPNSTPTNS